MRLRFGARLIDQPAATARARSAPAGNKLVSFDRDSDAVMRIEAAPRELDGDLADRRFDHFIFQSHGPSPGPKSRLSAASGQIAPG
jgi:hypothetical protein